MSGRRLFGTTAALPLPLLLLLLPLGALPLPLLAGVPAGVVLVPAVLPLPLLPLPPWPVLVEVLPPAVS